MINWWKMTDKELADQLEVGGPDHIYEEVPNPRALQKALIERAGELSWAEQNTRDCDPKTLWPTPRICRLPKEEIIRFYQTIIPFRKPFYHSSSVDTNFVTSARGYEQVRSILARNKIEPTTASPFIWDTSRLCEQCAPELESMIVQYSFSGDDMGDGNVPVYVRIVNLEKKVLAVPYVVINEEESISETSTRHSSWKSEWSINETRTRNKTIEKQVYLFCEDHEKNADNFMEQYFTKRNLEAMKTSEKWIEDGIPRTKIGKRRQQDLEAKTRLYREGNLRTFYDPSWIKVK